MDYRCLSSFTSTDGKRYKKNQTILHSEFKTLSVNDKAYFSKDNEEYENTAADDYLDYLSDMW